MKEIFMNGVGWLDVPDYVAIGSTVTGKWTEREDRILCACYPVYGVGVTSRILQRLRSGVSGRATYLGIKGRPRNGARPTPRPDTLGRVA